VRAAVWREVDKHRRTPLSRRDREELCRMEHLWTPQSELRILKLLRLNPNRMRDFLLQAGARWHLTLEDMEGIFSPWSSLEVLFRDRTSLSTFLGRQYEVRSIDSFGLAREIRIWLPTVNGATGSVQWLERVDGTVAARIMLGPAPILEKTLWAPDVLISALFSALRSVPWCMVCLYQLRLKFRLSCVLMDRVLSYVPRAALRTDKNWQEVSRGVFVKPVRQYSGRLGGPGGA